MSVKAAGDVRHKVKKKKEKVFFTEAAKSLAEKGVLEVGAMTVLEFN